MVLSILWNPLTKIPDPGKKTSTRKITRKVDPSESSKLDQVLFEELESRTGFIEWVGSS